MATPPTPIPPGEFRPMTPAERVYDVKLINSIREAEKWVRKRSGKVALILRQAAERLDELSRSAHINTVQAGVDDAGQAVPVVEEQPASPP